jgi:hypothetical protein
MERLSVGDRVKTVRWNPLSLPNSLVGSEGRVTRVWKIRVEVVLDQETKPRILHASDIQRLS